MRLFLSNADNHTRILFSLKRMKDLLYETLRSIVLYNKNWKV